MKEKPGVGVGVGGGAEAGTVEVWWHHRAHKSKEKRIGHIRGDEKKGRMRVVQECEERGGGGGGVVVTRGGEGGGLALFSANPPRFRRQARRWRKR